MSKNKWIAAEKGMPYPSGETFWAIYEELPDYETVWAVAYAINGATARQIVKEHNEALDKDA